MLAVFAVSAITLVAPRASAAEPFLLFPSLTTDKPLEFGNANKIVVGPLNILHAVYVTDGKVMYSTSHDGVG